MICCDLYGCGEKVVSFTLEGARAFLGIGPSRGPDRDVAKLGDVSYADDIAFVLAACAALILEQRMLAATIVWRAHEKCAFRLNFYPAKTAAPVRLASTEAVVMSGRACFVNKHTPIHHNK